MSFKYFDNNELAIFARFKPGNPTEKNCRTSWLNKPQQILINKEKSLKPSRKIQESNKFECDHIYLTFKSNVGTEIAFKAVCGG